MYYQLKAFPKFYCDDNGFLFKLHGIEYYKPIQPRRHSLAKHTGDFRFYITVDAKQYSVSQENLKAMKSNVIFRMEGTKK